LILVEWDTLFYLAGLFVIMEACHRLRLVDFIGDGMVRLIEQAPQETRLPVALLSILWIVTIISGLLDTVPLAIALVKVIALVASKLSLPVPALAWALAFGACLGQNSTIVGGANNVLAVSICERAGHGVSSRRWMSIGIPVVIITQTVITFYILVRYTSMPIPL
jgi:Na+/H+ antiporter NhaD/arsenite permease-like protein